MKAPKEFTFLQSAEYDPYFRDYFCSDCGARAEKDKDVDHKYNCKYLNAWMNAKPVCQDNAHELIVCPCRNDFHGHCTWGGPKGQTPIWVKEYCRTCKRIIHFNSDKGEVSRHSKMKGGVWFTDLVLNPTEVVRSHDKSEWGRLDKLYKLRDKENEKSIILFNTKAQKRTQRGNS